MIVSSFTASILQSKPQERTRMMMRGEGQTQSLRKEMSKGERESITRTGEEEARVFTRSILQSNREGGKMKRKEEKKRRRRERESKKEKRRERRRNGGEEEKIR